MKKVELLELRGRNFKGLKEFSSKFNGNTTVKAGNEQGKTTLNDLFIWVLFGKNSAFETKFSLKPLNEKNEAQENLETSGFMCLQIGDTKKTFERITQRVEEVKRGSKEVAFKTKNVFLVDGESISATEFKKAVADILPEADFMRLASITYFFDENRFDWKTRRQFLIEKSGVENFSEYALAKGETEKASKLAQLGYDKYKMNLDRSAKEHKKNAKELNISIKERNLDIKEEEEPTAIKDEILRQKWLLDGIIKEVQASIKKHQKNVDDEQVKARTLETDLAQKRFDKTRSEDMLSQLKEQKTDFKLSIDGNEKTLANIEKDKLKADKEIALLNEKKAVLAKEWTNINSETFVYNGSDCCQTCNQKLPAEMLNNAKKLAEKAFNSNKKLRQSTTVAKAERVNIEIDNIRLKLADPEKINRYNIDIHKKIAVLDERILKGEKVVIDLEKVITDLKESFDTAELKLDLTNSEIPNLRTEEKEDIRGIILDLENSMSDYNKSEDAKKRVKELKESMRLEAEKRIEFETTSIELEEMHKNYIDSITDRVNALFESDKLKIKMFDSQKNGGYSDTCQVLIRNDKGVLVDYNSANTAAKITAGVLVHNFQVRDLGVSVPLFIDNCESIESKRIPATDSQLIKLVMVEDKKELEII